MITNEDITKKNFVAGDYFYSTCRASCVYEPVKIYGTLVYSEDSSICKAA